MRRHAGLKSLADEARPFPSRREYTRAALDGKNAGWGYATDPGRDSRARDESSERLGDWLRAQGTGKIVVAGISLGGWVTNLHFSLYGRMDEYRPLFAGAALDHLFTDTIYRRLTCREARENPQALRRVLNFEPAFQAREGQSVFPLLARHDQYIRFERQRRIYANGQLAVLEKGHITGTMDTKAIRAHRLRGLQIDQPALRSSRLSSLENREKR
jgi:pimeloyl-ACP methyl ester carboxylesterase